MIRDERERGVLRTWPDLDVPPQLRAVGGAGGDGRGATGVERDEPEEEVQRKQSKQGVVARPVHVQDASDDGRRLLGVSVSRAVAERRALRAV